MLCLNCKFAKTDIVITDAEFEKLKHNAKEMIKSTLRKEIPDEIKDKIAEDMLPVKTKEEFINNLKRIKEDVMGRYPYQFYCAKKYSIVVANPDRPTQDIRECEFYTPK